MKHQIDEIDLHIMKILREDARITINDLATKIGVRRSTIYYHLSKLEEIRYLTGYSLIPDFKNMGYNITAFILINHQLTGDYKGYKEFSEKIAKIPYVTEVYAITGEFDYLIKVRVSSLEQMGDEVFNQLKQIKGISRMQTMTVFYTKLEELSNSKIPFENFLDLKFQ